MALTLTCLHLAAVDGALRLVELLLQSGAQQADAVDGASKHVCFKRVNKQG